VHLFAFSETGYFWDTIFHVSFATIKVFHSHQFNYLHTDSAGYESVAFFYLPTAHCDLQYLYFVYFLESDVLQMMFVTHDVMLLAMSFCMSHALNKRHQKHWFLMTSCYCYVCSYVLLYYVFIFISICFLFIIQHFMTMTSIHTYIMRNTTCV